LDIKFDLIGDGKPNLNALLHMIYLRIQINKRNKVPLQPKLS